MSKRPIFSISENLIFFFVLSFAMGISAPKNVQHGKMVPSYLRVKCWNGWAHLNVPVR